MSAPQLPPRPPPAQISNNPQIPTAYGPPVPPLPSGFQPNIHGYNPQPQYGDPLVAPRPQKLMSSVPAEMARTLESQMPGTPIPPPPPPPGTYGQQLPSISYSTPPIPGAYPATPQPQLQQNPGYQGQTYNPNLNYIPNQPYRGTTPLPYPGTPQPYQVQPPQQIPFAGTGPGLPPAGFSMQPPRLGPSPGPVPMQPPQNPNLAPGFTPRPQSWGGPTSPTPTPGPSHQRTGSGGYGPQLGVPQGGNAQTLQQGLQALSIAGIQAPLPNPHWVNGSTPPVSRPPSSLSPRPGQPPPSNRYNIDNSIAGLTFSEPAPPKEKTGPPQLTVPLPTVTTLTASLNPVMNSRDPTSKVAWCKDVLNTLEKVIQANGANIGDGPARQLLVQTGGPNPGLSESDAALLKLSETAVSTIVTILTPPLPVGPNNAMPPFIAEALFLRGQVIAAGTFPEKLPKSPRDAFRDFEASARGGYAPGWFKLGRDYETVGDIARAKDCFERGVQRGVGSCFYRLGMAHLQGQLGLPQNPTIAMPLLQRAAFLSSIEVAQPAYVYALLLLQEFPHITLPQQLLQSLVPPTHPFQTGPNTPPPSLMSESRKYLERSAYLGFGPALYKLGQSYEHAIPPFPYDPLMSVQYYSLASQQGDALADLALSKWFLVGSNPEQDPNAPPGQAHDGFDKDESLALIFAEKAATKGEPGGEFAMGYYCEVGIGGRPADPKAARGWYERAAKQGHADAKARLKELASQNPRLLGVQEHQGRLERMRTNAKERAKQNAATYGSGGGGGLAPPMPDAQEGSGGGEGRGAGGMLSPVSGANVMALARKSSRMNHTGSGRRPNVMQEFEKVGGGDAGPDSSEQYVVPPVSIQVTPDTTAQFSSNTTQAAAKPSTSSGSGTTTPGGKHKPATFAEMGYHSHKLEDKECIIM
ncbi:hypothetical protein FRC15_009550 [Serendipita sp. 397]|nr:hypothetical protein FRC15_009550 [Serendipita sp. 397]